MAAEAGLKPFETDVMGPVDVWIVLDGWEKVQRAEWERMRLLCFYIARFGNSDPKKMAKTPQAFMALPWDRKSGNTRKDAILELHAKRKALRERLEKQNK